MIYALRVLGVLMIAAWFANPAVAAADDYQVPGLVVPLKQPSDQTCWATVSTILIAWKDQASYSIDTVMQKAGAVYAVKFAADSPLLTSEMADFTSKLGLTAEAPQNYSIGGWQDLLKSNGPIWVTTSVMDPGNPFSAHARVITGITGDGSPDGTVFTLIDPAIDPANNPQKQTFRDFIAAFEAIARVENWARIPFIPQVVHN